MVALNPYVLAAVLAFAGADSAYHHAVKPAAKASAHAVVKSQRAVKRAVVVAGKTVIKPFQIIWGD